MKNTKMLKKISFIPCVVLILASCASENTIPVGQMNAQDIQTYLIDQEADYVGIENNTFFAGDVTLMPNGSIRFKTNSGAPESGTWRFKGQQICITLEMAYNGDEVCFTIMSRGDGSLVTSHNYLITLK